MAVVAEDEDLIAQAQERERARLEEEAAILAFQQQQQALAAQIENPQAIQIAPRPNFIYQPSAEIDALQAQFNAQAQPTAMPPPMPRQMIGDEQYQLEVARAQRGSGFINALVDPGGNVTVPGYDPSKDFAALKAQQEATNLQRNQYVNSLVQGGATYAEAFRAGQGRYPQAGNDSMRLRVEQLAQKTQPFTPRVQTIDGVPMVERTRGQWALLPQQKFVGGKASEATKIAADNIADQITALRRQIAPDSNGLVLLAPEKVAEIEARIAQKEKQRVDLFNTPEANPQVDQQGWRNMRQAWENPVSSRAPTVQPQALTADVARELLNAAGGDKAKARKMALDAGFRL